MSSEPNFITSLILAQTSLYKIGGPILMSLGTVSCIFSLIVFTKKNLRKNPCLIYLTACNITNFLLIYTSLLLATLSTDYYIDPSLYNLAFCRFRFYAMLLFDVLSPSYLILASVDRILLTSPNALTRQRSISHLAYLCIIAVTLFWFLFHSHALVFTNIIQTAPNFILCYFQPGIYLLCIGYYSIIIKGILVPLLMIVLGLWTVKNIRHVSRVIPTRVLTPARTKVIGNLRCAHPKDRHFIQILLVDISIYIIFSLMVSVVLMYQQFTQYQVQSLVQTQTRVFLVSVGIFIIFIYK